MSIQVSPYLSFKGQCEEAFALYQRCLGARAGQLFRYAGSPLAAQAPDGWGNKVMHGSVTIGNLVLMGGDVAPDRYEKPQGFALSLQLTVVADAERIFRELGEGGTVTMPLEKTFWAERFGMLTDRFGIPWLINCEASPPA